jgi:hypothetical protein
MRCMIVIPSALIPKVSAWLLKLGIELQEVPEVVVAAPATASVPAPAARPGRKSSGLPKGTRNFKCNTCSTVWTGPSKGAEKARWAESGLLCVSCHDGGVESTVDRNGTTYLTIMSEVEADLGDSLASDIEWADDMPL